MSVFDIVITLAVVFVISVTTADRIETRRYYKIQNADGSVLTVGGDNSRNVKIVTEELHGTDPRQTFWVGRGDETNEISPRAQNGVSSLVLNLDLASNLLTQDIRIFHRHQWWFINDLGDGNWQIQNARNARCLSSMGMNTQIVGEVCDKSSKNQTWIFTKVQ